MIETPQRDRVVGQERGGFVLAAVLGVGGMATVYLARRARRSGFVRPVAVKVLHPHHASDLELVEMFLQEARLVGRVRHPNVVAPIDVVVDAGEVVMAMEYVHGVTLAELTRAVARAGGAIPHAVTATILAGALHGLDAAHDLRGEDGERLDPVHRDVSPQNVMVGVHGEIKVLDFGVAKVVGRAPSTRTGKLKGKLAYMAPEQLQGGRVDRRTDVYAVGVVLWELLTLRRLCDGASEGEIVTQVLSQSAPPPSQVVAGVSPALDAIVARALSKDPASRFATAREMARALEAAGGRLTASELGEWVAGAAADALRGRGELLAALERGEHATGTPAAPDAATAATALLPGTTARRQPPAGRVVALGGVVGAAAIALGAALWWSGRSVKPVPAGAEAPAPVVSAGTRDRGAPTPDASSAPAQPAARAPEAPAPPSRPAPRRAAKGTAGAKPACADPYRWVDGIKYPRPECF